MWEKEFLNTHRGLFSVHLSVHSASGLRYKCFILNDIMNNRYKRGAKWALPHFALVRKRW